MGKLYVGKINRTILLQPQWAARNMRKLVYLVAFAALNSAVRTSASVSDNPELATVLHRVLERVTSFASGFDILKQLAQEAEVPLNAFNWGLDKMANILEIIFSNTFSWPGGEINNNSASMLNTLRPRQNGRHFPDDIFKWIFLNENVRILIKISQKFVPRGLINNTPALV